MIDMPWSKTKPNQILLINNHSFVYGSGFNYSNLTTIIYK